MYLIGTKDQFNSFEVSKSPLAEDARYVVDEAGFVLYDADSTASRDLDGFGPYGIEQSVLADSLSKSEVASGTSSTTIRTEKGTCSGASTTTRARRARGLCVGAS